MRVAIVTDTNSGISVAEGRELGVFVLPMPLLVDGQIRYEGVDLTPEEFYAAQQAGRDVSTSQPSPGDVMDLWDRVLEEYDALVYIPMSSGLSASCQTALALAESYDGRVQVADLRRISVTQKLAVLDGYNHCVYVDPAPELLGAMEDKRKDDLKQEALLQGLKKKPNVTLDGREVKVYANIGNAGDVGLVLQNDAQGIGLFRSEFIYLDSADYPSEDHQFTIYKRVVETMAGKKVIIRTLDIGADKQVDYFEMHKEENPALGVRAIRICLNRPEVFRTQLRALYRASAYGKVAIMFPMITSVWEVKECKRACQKVMAELDKEGVPYRKDTEIGIMIETPASVLVAEELAKEVDFFSVGTNDLTQYTLACDRQANDLGKFFDPHHPAVLRALKMAADAAHKAGIWIGICGELGADLELLETFLAIGIDELSVSPTSVLPLRAEIRKSIAKTCTLEKLEC